MTPPPARDAALVIIDALRLARERVTGSTLAVKEARKAALKEAIALMALYLENGSGAPSGEQLRELLGDQADRNVTEAVDAWDVAVSSGDVPVSS